ncbi:Hypothetical protein I595_275 [Croceitalea dokdonensis DOKDO 023]|uniref:Lipocalin-like domain-containing protein n=1 Tax=Croceitalea dokdonensis DOKDO 023 TaxID=1300341 RepID=A0A0N8H4H3_9FLAO|nr:hypothetical protein [Croceitalea dokdonensis]KPM33372.1 Hypothetical protein I595_275 [Croceitalea dokdonensis DOKDO 023]
MKTIKSNLARTFLAGILMATAISCSSDEDEVEQPEPQVDISYRVQVTKIKATDTSGEGNADNVELEIFGELSSSLTIGTTVDTRILWSADLENLISVGQNDTQLTGTTTFTVTEDELSTSSITCSGDLDENDGGGNIQNQGQESSTFSLANITDTQDIDLTFSEPAGQTVVVTFVVTRL